MKISTKILIGLFIFLVGGLFASNMILKKEYDNPQKRDRFSDFKTVLQQPFKHLKIVGGKNCGLILISQSDKSEVKVSNTWTNFVLDTTQKYIKNDTLFLTFTQKEKSNSYTYSDGLITIFASEILSIQSDNSSLQLDAFKQKTLDIRLSNASLLDISRYFSDLDSLKVSLSGISQLNFMLTGKQGSNHFIKAQAVEANLRDSSKLYLNLVDIKTLKLISTPNSEVQLSSGTLQTLLKQ